MIFVEVAFKLWQLLWYTVNAKCMTGIDTFREVDLYFTLCSYISLKLSTMDKFYHWKVKY